MQSICGSDCCAACPQKTACGGCRETGGHPFGGVCVAAAYIEKSGPETFADWKRSTMEEINALHIPDLQIDSLHLLNGFYVNLEYRLPNGQAVTLGRNAVMASLPTKRICWCANMAVMARTRRSSVTNEGGCQNEKLSNLPQMRRA